MRLFFQKLILPLFIAGGFFYCNQETSQSAPRKMPLPEYTVDEPGQWYEQKDTHNPQLEYRQNLIQGNLLVYLNYKDKNPNHRVEIIGLVDEQNKDVLPPTKFGAPQDYYQATFTIDSFSEARRKKWRIYAKCTQHDLWTRRINDSN